MLHITCSIQSTHVEPTILTALNPRLLGLLLYLLRTSTDLIAVSVLTDNDLVPESGLDRVRERAQSGYA